MKEKTKRCDNRMKQMKTEESADSFIQKCSVIKIFEKIVQNSQENTCDGVFF